MRQHATKEGRDLGWKDSISRLGKWHDMSFRPRYDLLCIYFLFLTYFTYYSYLVWWRDSSHSRPQWRGRIGGRPKWHNMFKLFGPRYGLLFTYFLLLTYIFIYYSYYDLDDATACHRRIDTRKAHWHVCFFIVIFYTYMTTTIFSNFSCPALRLTHLSLRST